MMVQTISSNNDVNGARTARKGSSSGKGQWRADLGRYHAKSCLQSHDERGCDGLSPTTSLNGTRKSTEKTSKKIRSTASIRIATINVRTCQEDLKLAQVIKAASQLSIDILAIQEARRLHNGHVVLKDDSIFGWQLVWSGHKRKHQHGVAILLAPHVTLEEHFVFLDARIIAVKVKVHGMRLSILNGYAPCDSSK